MEQELARSEASVSLQVQRCMALEDRVTELEAALVGARDQRDAAKAQAESALAEASRVFDELEAEHSMASERSAPTAAPPASADAALNEALQSKLLEVERLRSERDGLRRSLGEWRRQAQTFRRERDEANAGLERLAHENKRLVERAQTDAQRVGELEREVNAQARELEVAERRTKHLREHMTG